MLLRKQLRNQLHTMRQGSSHPLISYARAGQRDGVLASAEV